MGFFFFDDIIISTLDMQNCGYSVGPTPTEANTAYGTYWDRVDGMG